MLRRATHWTSGAEETRVTMEGKGDVSGSVEGMIASIARGLTERGSHLLDELGDQFLPSHILHMNHNNLSQPPFNPHQLPTTLQ